MAKFKANEEQLEFINSDGYNVLVSASAGSGKTSTMIQKLAKILSEKKIPITSLLVVTYTNAAGSEIKQKLYDALSSLILETKDLELKNYLKTQLENLNNAEIGTLHSICKKLITKYFYELEQSPDFSLISEKDSKYLINTSIKSVFDKHIKENDNEFYELYECYNSKRSDATLKEIVLNLYNYVLVKTDYTQWKNQTILNSYNPILDNNSACDFIWKYYKSIISSLLPQLKKLLDVAKNNNYDTYYDFLNTRNQFIYEFVASTSFSQSIKILNNITLSNKPRVSKKFTPEQLVFDEDISLFRDEFKSVIEELENIYVLCDEENFTNNITNAKLNVLKLFSLAEEVKDFYSLQKKKKNVLDFNDLEELMLKLLDNEIIRDTLKDQYKYIFVDEYQDINDKQETILLKLVSKDNYYMIGDVKQSIYAFRQSSPKIFVSKYNEFSHDNKVSRVIDFNKNYRSDKNILEFNNYVFDNLITEETIGIDYKNNARFMSDKTVDGVKVNLNIIDTEVDEDDNETSVSKDEAEALVIANEIAEILQKEKNDGTKFTYGDIAIILRQRGSLTKLLYETFTKMQIPFSITIRSDFFDTSEIKLMIAILKVISNYKDDLSVATVLKNMFDVSEEELLSIKSQGDYKYFYEHVFNYNKEDEILYKIRRFYDFISISRDKLCNCTISDYLQFVIDEYDILINLKSLPKGNERESNILEFISLADNDNYKYNIDKFLEYVEFVSKETPVKKISSGANAVQICTIHYSKGLEYPAVILGGLGSKYSLNRNTNNIIISGNFGVGLKSINSDTRTLKDTVVRYACKLDNKKSAIDEEIRLLYVAMTRPKEYLSLVGRYNLGNLAENKLKSIYNTTTSLDMIFKAVPDVYNSSFINKDSFIINENLDNAFNVNIIKLSNIELQNTQESDVSLDHQDSKLIKELQKVYENKIDLSTFTIKNTVTNILQEEEDYENINYSPKTLSINDEIEDVDFLKLGTTYHSIMQSLNFTENIEEIKKIIDNLVVSNVISQDMVNLIDINEIYNANKAMLELTKNAVDILKEKQFIMREDYNKLVKNSDNNTKVIVQGVIDLAVIKKDEVILVDYKTNRTNNTKLLIEKYRLQLEIYKLAFEKATNLKVDKLYLYSFYQNKLIEIN